MTAIPTNLLIEQGTNFESEEFIIPVYNNINVPLNLTSYTAVSKLKKSYTATSFSNLQVTFTNRSAGKIKLSLSNSATGLLKQGRYVYDLVIISSTGDKRRVIEGIATVTPGVS